VLQALIYVITLLNDGWVACGCNSIVDASSLLSLPLMILLLLKWLNWLQVKLHAVAVDLGMRCSSVSLLLLSNTECIVLVRI